MPSFYALKTHNNALFRPKKKCVFNIHDPRYIFKPITGLSPLNSHKRRHKFLNTRTDRFSCGLLGAEDTSHFSFDCPLHAIYIVFLAASVVGDLALKNLNHLSIFFMYT